MTITSRQLIAACTLGLVAVISLGLTSGPKSGNGSGSNSNLDEVLESFSSGNVLFGPGVVEENNLIAHPKPLATSPTTLPAGGLTIANLGETSVEVTLVGEGTLGLVMPGETLGLFAPGGNPGPLSITSTDIGDGDETRVVWVVRQLVP